MDAAKSHGFFLASFLVLVFLGDPTEACDTCPEISLRDACCHHDFVIRVQFMGVKRHPNPPSSMNMNVFTIRPHLVFKGPMYLRNGRVLFSPAEESSCGYHHKGPFTGDDYLISGIVDDNGPQIRKCSLAIPWEDVPLSDKMNLEGVAGRNCRTICPQG